MGSFLFANIIIITFTDGDIAKLWEIGIPNLSQMVEIVLH